MSTVWFRIGQFRDVWLGSADGLIPYFWANVIIACSLGALASFELATACRRPRSRSDLAITGAVVVFVLGFGFRLAFLHSHHLNSQWYAEVTKDEPFDSHRNFLGVVKGEPSGPSSLIQVETCEEVYLELPDSPSPSKVVVVEELRGRYTGARRLQVTSFVQYHDLCTFLFDYTRDQTSAGCLTSRCS